MSLYKLGAATRPPWTVEGPSLAKENQPTLLTVGNADFGFIEIVRVQTEEDQVAVANAIAALPELLKAAQDVLESLQRRIYQEPCMQALSDAVAKCTGEVEAEEPALGETRQARELVSKLWKS